MTEVPLWGGVWALMVAFGLGHLLYVGRVNPEILRHRSWLKRGTETWDWVWFSVFIPVFCAIFVIANLDLRSGWALLPQWVRPVGLALFVLGGGLFLRAMAENPFFEKTVRIQSERNHRVIDTGPYRVVRHPGYVGMVVWVLSFPLLLTSGWAILPAAFTASWFILRTALEDRTLHRKLPGYREYAGQVRSRLIPGVW